MLINVAGKLLDLSSPKIMGIINVTPDSFYAKSRKNILEGITTAENFINEGCDIIDIGAYSSWIHSKDIDSKEEWSRLEPLLIAIRKEFPYISVSIDTFRSDVAKQAIEHGANIINDISAGNLDNQLLDVIAKYNIPYVLMHMQGNPNTMQNFTNYDNLIIDIMHYFIDKLKKLRSLKIKDIIIDPGFGFSKTLEQNYMLLNDLDKFKILDLPILVGLSRKSMIYKLLNITPEGSLNGTSVLNFVALNKGANILRVHDVKEAKQTIDIFNMLMKA